MHRCSNNFLPSVWLNHSLSSSSKRARPCGWEGVCVCARMCVIVCMLYMCVFYGYD